MADQETIARVTQELQECGFRYTDLMLLKEYRRLNPDGGIFILSQKDYEELSGQKLETHLQKSLKEKSNE